MNDVRLLSMATHDGGVVSKSTHDFVVLFQARHHACPSRSRTT